MTEPTAPRSKDPLHGVTLERIVTTLVESLGWDELGNRIEIRCFTNDPSVQSALKFLRKTPWAREKIERLFIHVQRKEQKAKKADNDKEQPSSCRNKDL